MRNGDRWRITTVHHDGSVTVRRRAARFGGAVRLPAAYVAHHLDLGYAITVHRAQGATVDTAHAIIHSNQMTRESLYVSMTRGRDSNIAYVAIDQFPLEEHQKTPEPDITAHSVLAHETAERSAHEMLRAEHERWGSIAQLAGEYDTIAEHVQQDRWITLLEQTALTHEQVDEVIASEAFGALAGELRRADAENYDLPRLLPELIAARSLAGADDLASVIRHRLQTATTSRTGSTRTRAPARLIAGIIYEVTDDTDPDSRRALDERRTLIEQRADILAQHALTDQAPWLRPLGPIPTSTRTCTEWDTQLRTVVAYRDRYGITDPQRPLGDPPQTRNQSLDAGRAQAAIATAARLAQPAPGPANSYDAHGHRL